MDTTTSGKARMVLPLHPQLMSRARRLTGNEADAKDLVQDAIEKALRTPRTPADDGEMRPWLNRVLTHLWIDRVRAAKVRRHVPLDDEGMCGPMFGFWNDEDTDGPASSAWGNVSLQDVRSALQEVPEPYRRAFQGHALDRRSYAELARELGIQPVTVGTRVLRARHQLRKILQARMGEERREEDLNVHRNVA